MSLVYNAAYLSTFYFGVTTFMTFINIISLLRYSTVNQFSTDNVWVKLWETPASEVYSGLHDRIDSTPALYGLNGITVFDNFNCFTILLQQTPKFRNRIFPICNCLMTLTRSILHLRGLQISPWTAIYCETRRHTVTESNLNGGIHRADHILHKNPKFSRYLLVLKEKSYFKHGINDNIFRYVFQKEPLTPESEKEPVLVSFFNLSMATDHNKINSLVRALLCFPTLIKEG